MSPPPMPRVAGRRPGAAVPTAAGPPRSPRRFILAAVALAALGYGGYWGYNWFVEGRFLVSTDDAYVGADTAIIAAKVAGHIVEVAVADNRRSTPATCWRASTTATIGSRSTPPGPRSRPRTRRSPASAGRSRRRAR